MVVDKVNEFQLVIEDIWMKGVVFGEVEDGVSIYELHF